MTLKSVVLPAPLGPIRAVIEPPPTSKVAPSTARMPPKRLTTPSTSSRGPLRESVAKHHLLSLAEHSLGAERHQQDQRRPDDEESQRRRLLFADRQLDEEKTAALRFFI